MRRARLLALVPLPALASCSFLLDFDSLQRGTGGAAGMHDTAGRAGQAGSAGTPSNGGTGATNEAGATSEAGATNEAGSGGAGCPAACFHDDPCLESGCTANGECKSGQATGLVLDGVDETLRADTHYRVTLASGDDAFYLSGFANQASKNELTFYRLKATGSSLEAVASLGGLNLDKVGDPVSAAGLTFESGLGLVHAFVAVDDRAGTGTRVWHLVMDQNFGLKTPIAVGSLAEGYWSDSPYNYPASIESGGQIYGAWINQDQTISLSDGTALGTPVQLSTATPAMTLSLFTSADDKPHVLYGVYGGGVFIERPGLAPYQIAECQDAAGAYVSSTATGTGIPGLWLTSWTKVSLSGAPGYLTTNGRGVLCGSSGCIADTNACDGSSDNNLIRNPAAAIVRRPGAPTGEMTVVQATPYISTAGSAPQAGLILTQTAVDLGNPPFVMPPTSMAIAEPIVLSTQEASPPAYRGPDLPVVGFVPPDRFAVAWIQSSTTTGDELRVRKYKLCSP